MSCRVWGRCRNGAARDEDVVLHLDVAEPIAEMCERFREVFPRHESEVWVYGDASGRGRPAQTGQSDYTVILQTMKTYPVPLRLKVSEATPLVSMRVNAVNRLLRDEHGQVRVLVVISRNLSPGVSQNLSSPERGRRPFSAYGIVSAPRKAFWA
jgi:hypothetical protein